MKTINPPSDYTVLRNTLSDKQELKERTERRKRVLDLTLDRSIVLIGEDAKRFHEHMAYNELHPASQHEKDRIRASYNLLKAIQQF